MSENNDTNNIGLGGGVTVALEIVCPHCDRVEEFDDQLTAWAWGVGHVQEAHPDKLPSFK